MTDDVSLDFLDDAAAGTPVPTGDAQVAVEAVRAPMLDWAARTLAVRAPAATVYRSNKGVAQCRLDLDRHLKAVLEAGANAQGALAQYRKWALAAIWAPRGSTVDDFDAGLQTLAESLVRFVAWPHGPRLAARLENAAHRHDPQVQTAIAQRCTSG